MTLDEARDHVERAIGDVSRDGFHVMWDRFIDRLIITHIPDPANTREWVETTINLDQ